MKTFRMQKKKSRSAEILLYDEIGQDFFGNGVTAKQFAEELRDLGDVDEINLRINSPGGSVFDGMAIYNSLARHPARITADVDGVAASAASVVLLAGEVRRVASNAFVMVHDPYSISIGTPEDHAAESEKLSYLREQIVDTYVRRTGTPESKIKLMMADETWLNAGDAVHFGFAQSVAEEQTAAACVDSDRWKYRHTPVEVELKQRQEETGARLDKLLSISA